MVKIGFTDELFDASLEAAEVGFGVTVAIVVLVVTPVVVGAVRVLVDVVSTIVFPCAFSSSFLHTSIFACLQFSDFLSFGQLASKQSLIPNKKLSQPHIEDVVHASSTLIAQVL